MSKGKTTTKVVKKGTTPRTWKEGAEMAKLISDFDQMIAEYEAETLPRPLSTKQRLDLLEFQLHSVQLMNLRRLRVDMMSMKAQTEVDEMKAILALYAQARPVPKA